MSNYLEANMEIIRNNQDLIIYITGKKIRDREIHESQIINLMAFDLRGSTVQLSLVETHRAENILLREEERK